MQYESKAIMKRYENYGVKSDILLDQQLMTQEIMMKNYKNQI